ncbi:MAG TPA: hypothetical protein VK943_11095 [Arenibaculum sp.]|nr:hypothetical protein [Arenibaculum sp.]
MHADHTNREPSVEELLADPIAIALMKRDGIDARDVLLLIEEMRRRLGPAGPRAEAA